MGKLARAYRPLGLLAMIRGLRRAATGVLLLAFTGNGATATDFPPIGSGGEHHPGKFIWLDLVTDDLAAARNFYGAVFGWQFRSVESAPASYTVVEHAGRPIAGMFLHAPPPEKAGGARWLSLISVGDPDQVARYVKEQGGSIVAPVAALAGRGTHALFRDPQGALFGVLQSATGDPPDTPVADGDFFWFDLLAGDPAQAAEFYREIGGYALSVREVGEGVTRVMLASGGYARAGIAALPPAVKHPGWLPYVLVEDVSGTLDKVRKAGGTVLVEPRAELLDGNLAVITDPRGGVVGLVNWTQADDAAVTQ